MFVRILVLFLAGVAAAEDFSKSGADKAQPAQAADTSMKSVLLLGTSLPSTVAQGIVLSRETLVRAVYGATQLARTGQVVQTGTLTQTAAGWQYAAQPADKLVVKMAKVTQEFVLKDAQGNAQAATAEAFLGANHYLHYTHHVAGSATLEIKFRNANSNFVAEITGQATHQQTAYRVNLRSQGTHVYVGGSASGSETTTKYNLTGEMTAPGFRLTVSETHYFRIVTSTMGSASESTDTFANVAQVGNDKYEWKDVSFRKVFTTRNVHKAMRPSDPDRKWKIQGYVFKNGQKVGVYHMGVQKAGVDARRKYHGNVEVRLKTPTETLTIQTFTGG